ncbi:NAD-dependent epimerase/dehydratase family protein [Chitinophaga sp. SYP-B3965]|uniref:NAD-dependent epimerase/dehydratase family protein n=1 Tax=Chitinophaga sp. SYP-B3965 TaxID=2663120 RepID=UPI0012997E2A|nr:NAD-dependent epimerase/dehydratase family protein [Chitinophaga sp. SYP-B3965]MRG45850.1 NAD-dependent epimerase/dehydratase family protein [Chitinophaga sp. SYP-B3965]
MNVIITGSTGMVGEGVLHECLQNPDISAVLLINRKPLGVKHPKLKEIIHGDFFELSSIESELRGYDACYFCLGVSAIGMNEADYYKMTYTLTLYMAQILSKANPEMIFCYVSGSGTDSSEKGRVMWARVKGKTENDLMNLPFKKVYAFRPGYMQPTKGLKNVKKYYHYMSWMYPFARAVFPSFVSTLKELGQAMIEVTKNGYSKKVLEVKDIVKLAKSAT